MWVLVTGALLALAALFVYLGGLYKIEFTEGSFGPYHAILKPHRGDYTRLGSVSGKLAPRLVAAGVTELRYIGIFYDNPALVEKQDLRSEVGFLVPATVTEVPDELKEECVLKDIPAAEYLATQFPYRFFLSIVMAILRVYPKLSAEIEARGLEQSYRIEIYRPDGEGRMLFLIPRRPTEEFAGPVS